MLVLLTPPWKAEKQATRIRRRMSVDIFRLSDAPPVWALSTRVLSDGILSVISLSLVLMRKSVKASFNDLCDQVVITLIHICLFVRIDGGFRSQVFVAAKSRLCLGKCL